MFCSPQRHCLLTTTLLLLASPAWHAFRHYDHILIGQSGINFGLLLRDIIALARPAPVYGYTQCIMASTWLGDVCATHLGTAPADFIALLSRCSDADANAAGVRDGAAVAAFVSGEGSAGGTLYVFTALPGGGDDAPPVTPSAVASEVKRTTIAATTTTPISLPASDATTIASTSGDGGDAATAAHVNGSDELTDASVAAAAPREHQPPKDKAAAPITLRASLNPPPVNAMDASTRVLYFMRTGDGPLAPPPPSRPHSSTDGEGANAAAEAEAAESALRDYMSDRVEYGERALDVLASLEPILTSLFIPMLSGGGKNGGPDDGDADDDATSLYSGMPGAPGLAGSGGAGMGGTTTFGRTVGSVMTFGGGLGGGHRSQLGGSVMGGLLGRSTLGAGNGRGAGGEGDGAGSGGGSVMTGGFAAGGAGTSSGLLRAGGGSTVTGRVGSVLGGGGAGLSFTPFNQQAAAAAAAATAATAAQPSPSLLPPPLDVDLASLHLSEGVRAEFRSAMGRLALALSHTHQQLSGDVKLRMPVLPMPLEDDAEVEAAAQDEVTKVRG